MWHWKQIIFYWAALACFLVPLQSGYAGEISMFRYRGELSDDLAHFPKWTDMLKRASQSDTTSCSEPDCDIRTLDDVVKSLPNTSGVALLRAVNDHFNQAHYILDIKNWGLNDYWATPLQFLMKHGDCEDYAIAKYMALRKLGVPVSRMQIVVLQDENLDILHSVLAVWESGKHYILDNQIKSLVTDQDIHHYRPIYSINETAWRRYFPN